jgi:hypothetical protein
MDNNRDFQEEYKKIATQLAEELKKNLDEILGVSISGSIISNDADEYSDIDLDIWLSDETYEKWIVDCPLMTLFEKYGIKQETLSNYSFGLNEDYKIDMAILSIDEVRKTEWKIEQKANRYKSIIIFDSEDTIKNLLEEKLGYKNEEFTTKENYSVTIPNPEEYYSFYISAYLNYFIPLSTARGKIEQAHLNLNWTINLLLEIQWIKNKKFFPYTKKKWDVVDKCFNNEQKELIKQAQLIKEYTIYDIKRRRSLLRELYKKLSYEETVFYHGKIDLS